MATASPPASYACVTLEGPLAGRLACGEPLPSRQMPSCDEPREAPPRRVLIVKLDRPIVEGVGSHIVQPGPTMNNDHQARE
jgi:hypothetical protein